jgi:hypothetical protein
VFETRIEGRSAGGESTVSMIAGVIDRVGGGADRPSPV